MSVGAAGGWIELVTVKNEAALQGPVAEPFRAWTQKRCAPGLSVRLGVTEQVWPEQTDDEAYHCVSSVLEGPSIQR
jgi:hypothetical protein